MRRRIVSIGIALAGTAAAGILSAAPISAAGAAAPAYLLGVGCGSTSHCQVVGGSSNQTGAVAGTTNGGASWRHESVPSNVTFEDKEISRYVACADGNHCIAVAASGIAHTANGGTSWKLVKRAPINAVDCPTSSRCYAVGTTAFRSGNAGATWQKLTLPASFRTIGGTGLSCGTKTSCVLVGFNTDGKGITVHTSNSGATWAKGALPSGTTSVGAVSCRSTTCEAIGMAHSRLTAFRSTNNGATWTARALPKAARSYSTISCTSKTACVALLGTPALTTNGGSTWTFAKIPANSYFNDLSCRRGTSVCMAVGFSNNTAAAFRSTNGGKSWTTQKV